MTQTAAPMTGAQKRLYVSCCYTFCINGVLALMLGAMLPYLRQSYEIDYALAGMLLSMHSIGNLVSSYLAGVLPLYIGRKASAAVLCACGALAFVLMVVSSNPAVLLLAFFLTGINRGNVSNVNNSVVNDIATGKAWALNVLHGVFAIGAFCAPFFVLLCTRNDPARWVVAALALAFGCATQVVVYAMLPLPNNRPQRSAAVKGSSGYLRDKRFWVAGGILFFYLCAEQGVNGWLVTYFKDSGMMSDAFAQSMASILWLFILAGRLTCAALSTRVKKSKLLCISAVGYLAFFILTLASRSFVPAAVGIVGLGFCMAGLYPTTLADVGGLLRDYPLALSTLLVVAGMGAIIMPAIIGAVAARVGIIGGMSTIIVAVGVTIVLIFYNAWMKRKEPA